MLKAFSNTRNRYRSLILLVVCEGARSPVDCCSSTPASRATSAEADDKSIPPRINAGFPAKGDEQQSTAYLTRTCQLEIKHSLYHYHFILLFR
jgi:hypothetical protein